MGRMNGDVRSRRRGVLLITTTSLFMGFLGAVLGISLLIAILDTSAGSGEALGSFRQAWLLAALLGAPSTLIAVSLGRVFAHERSLHEERGPRQALAAHEAQA
jgi:hypothetical protein